METAKMKKFSKIALMWLGGSFVLLMVLGSILEAGGADDDTETPVPATTEAQPRNDDAAQQEADDVARKWMANPTSFNALINKLTKVRNYSHRVAAGAAIATGCGWVDDGDELWVVLSGGSCVRSPPGSEQEQQQEKEQ